MKLIFLYKMQLTTFIVFSNKLNITVLLLSVVHRHIYVCQVLINISDSITELLYMSAGVDPGFIEGGGLTQDSLGCMEMYYTDPACKAC